MLCKEIAEGFVGKLLNILHAIAREPLERRYVSTSNSMSFRVKPEVDLIVDFFMGRTSLSNATAT
jgi:hypothetical protein